MRYFPQAVLRRERMDSPLRLIGIMLEGTFHPASPSDARHPSRAETGLVALSPLTPVIADHPEAVIPVALLDARERWATRDQEGPGAGLVWRRPLQAEPLPPVAAGQDLP